jgi:hypothetical protein
MTEIHEPIRLQLVVEATEETISGIFDRQPQTKELVTNEWVKLILAHPTTGALSVYRRGEGLAIEGVVRRARRREPAAGGGGERRCLTSGASSASSRARRRPRPRSAR